MLSFHKLGIIQHKTKNNKQKKKEWYVACMHVRAVCFPFRDYNKSLGGMCCGYSNLQCRCQIYLGGVKVKISWAYPWLIPTPSSVSFC